MKKPLFYILDSDVLITAKNSYYGFEFCSGFWESLLGEYKHGRVFSISRVRGELLSGTKSDNLVQWISGQVPSTFFLDVDEDQVTARFTEVMLWSQRHTRYSDAAKAKFATGADGWLVAYGMVHGAIVVTNEQPRPDAIRDIKLPDVCNQFKVRVSNTFMMLRDLGVQLDLRATDKT